MLMGFNNSWLFLILLFIILSATFNGVLISAQCLKDQRLLLLQLKGSLNFDQEVSTKLVKWSTDENCCNWNGVGCDTSGRVTRLELDWESISGGIENSTSLFKLQYLLKLNLAYNNFSFIQIPSGIAKLKNLVHLNLSGAGFGGQIPIELSYLKKLVSLDLSTQTPFFEKDNTLKLGNPNLKTLSQDLQNIEELYLDGVDISAQRSNWSQSLASSLPRLRILSLRDCLIKGPIDSSLSKLHSLSVIQLDWNHLKTTVPDFFTNFSNLTTLTLSGCRLLGTFPANIFQVSTLQNLDLSNNELLHGSLEQFPHNGSLKKLVLRHTKFSGSLYSSISNLHNLSKIDLSDCYFTGPIPPSMENLSKLVHLDFSYNSFTGPIPCFQRSKNLSFLDLSTNELTGSLSPAHFGGLLNLECLILGSNLLTGNIPSSIFALPSLHYLDLSSNDLTGSLSSSIFTLPLLNYLDLSNNKLSGKIDEFPNALSLLIESLSLHDNILNGSIPKSIFELRKLKVLDLSSNSFTGTIQLETTIRNLVNLTDLNLSHNKISVDPRISNSSSLPQLTSLNLASCKLKVFPELANQSHMSKLDLSDNQIKGEVPNWIWKLGVGYRYERFHVNLSSNLFIGLQKPYNLTNYFDVLDLHTNHFQGEIPIPLSASYVDYSNNNFNNSIPPDVGNIISNAYFFSLANNSLTGTIPESLCNATLTGILDLSQNFLTGKLPSCLVENMGYLGVLNLARNNLTDSIPDTFSDNCRLQTLDLSSNDLRGKIPGSLINCTDLEVLNIGNNKLEDTFPCNLKNSFNLRVLVLRSNKLYGDVICHGGNNFWPMLQIIDIASNNFEGVLTPDYFLGWEVMMLDDDTTKFQGNHLKFGTYQDKVSVTLKGLEFELAKILKIFTSVDFSSNKLTGNIPDTIGDLKFLHHLNLSHNAFTGRIPSSIGNLSSLESLDLSVNRLSGEIPATLGNINFLSFLNLSLNNLSGRIPTGSQLQTFTTTSYEGNRELCGSPLNTDCFVDSILEMPSHSKADINWEFVTAAAGFSVGLSTFVFLLLLCRSWRQKYFYYVDKLLLKMLNQKGGRSIAEHWFRNQPFGGAN